ncbi:thiamine-phosphate synthase [Puia dinghuensis]|uniref:Thiamine-phosphate synthase n=2 Tax=Puia dinghuensis TaxID=1792502 RepID=A0A8J2UH37_9BACT|nr:thiamine-phosphate synthase [Puia dinghuensis]
MIARLHFLTMDDVPVGHVRQVEEACQAGIRWIQLRMKLASDEEVLAAARAAKKICSDWDSVLIINDRVAVAAEVGAHGVHLGKQDMAVSEARRILGGGAIIGGTANTVEDIREHLRQGADYIGLGPYRYTTTKKNLSPTLGLEGYQRTMNQMRKEAMHLPVVAIGGIGMKDAVPLLKAGLHGIAFSGMLVHAGDRRQVVRTLEEEIKLYDDVDHSR